MNLVINMGKLSWCLFPSMAPNNYGKRWLTYATAPNQKKDGRLDEFSNWHGRADAVFLRWRQICDAPTHRPRGGLPLAQVLCIYEFPAKFVQIKGDDRKIRSHRARGAAAHVRVCMCMCVVCVYVRVGLCIYVYAGFVRACAGVGAGVGVGVSAGADACVSTSCWMERSPDLRSFGTSRDAFLRGALSDAFLCD